MLRNYLTSVPCSKFIIIEDTIEERGKPVFDFLLNYHLGNLENSIHYFVFHENFNRAKKNLQSKNNIVLHDCISTVFQQNKDNKTNSFEQILRTLGSKDVVFVDSLAHVIYQYGLPETYKILNSVKTQTCIIQIICLLHLDLLEKNLRVDEIFKHLCTLCISIQPKCNTDNRRIKYLYKKIGGKITSGIEEYYFENNNFFTQKVEKIDVKKVLENTNTVVDFEALSTFKIGLNEEEKKVRDKLILPYLPNAEDHSVGGSIFYDFDEQDDWDEEDPDDDLDI